MHSEEFAELQKTLSELRDTVIALWKSFEASQQAASYESQQQLFQVAEPDPINHHKGVRVVSPEDVYELVKETARLEQEELRVILLNRKHIVIDIVMVFRGTIDSSIVDPKDIFRLAVRKCAVAIILSHNHPSGDASESVEDVRATKQIAEAGKMLNIQLLDHIVVGKGCFVSMKEKGVI